MSKGNIIDISSHLKRKSKNNTVKNENKAQVLDMQERRQAAITSERRVIKRTILTEFIGFKIVVPQKGLMEVALFDISSDGLAFETDSKLNHLSIGSEIAVRIYLTQKSYFGFSLKITNVRFEKDENVFRYGTKLIKDEMNKTALQSFVKFIEAVSPTLRSDNGDLVTHITR